MPDRMLTPPRQVTEPVADHGEGPVWDEHLGRVLWVDMLNGDILSTDPSTGETERHKGPEDVAAVLRRTCDGQWVLVGREHIWRGDLTHWQRCGSLELSPGARANEGGCDPAGYLFIGTMAEDEHEGGGAVYRFDGSTVAVSHAPTTISNGMVFDDEGCWFIDSPTRQIRRYRIADNGEWTALSQRIDTGTFAGVPDGMCADSDGGLWVAFYGGASVVRFEPNGRADIKIDVAAECPTACCFGGPDGDELFITTSRFNRDVKNDPLAGALFSVSTPFRGSEVGAFASPHST